MLLISISLSRFSERKKKKNTWNLIKSLLENINIAFTIKWFAKVAIFWLLYEKTNTNQLETRPAIQYCLNLAWLSFVPPNYYTDSLTWRRCLLVLKKPPNSLVKLKPPANLMLIQLNILVYILRITVQHAIAPKNSWFLCQKKKQQITK